MAPPFTKPYIEPSQKRIRVLFGGKFIIDTNEAQLVWEHAYYPTYFFPSSVLSSTYLQDTKDGVYDLVVGDKRAPGAVTKLDDGELKGLLKVNWSAADAWFEEEEQAFVHAKDPYKRVDILQSSRHVRVVAPDGTLLADTRQPRRLFETALRVRTYIPKVDCAVELLVPSETTTQCPYKGVANYYDVHLPSGGVLKDVVWWYRAPQPECADIRGYAAFYDEKLDVWVDGEKQAR